MKGHNKNLGEAGENLAVDYLEERGYKIIERNFQNKWGEIDIVAEDKNEDIIVFVEVKTRIGEKFGLPEDAINKNKMNKLIKNADAYMRFKKNQYRIDAICVVLNEEYNLERINYYKNITLY
jgi:putative endonuclease